MQILPITSRCPVCGVHHSYEDLHVETPTSYLLAVCSLCCVCVCVCVSQLYHHSLSSVS